MTKAFVVMANGKVFAGVSTISGRAIWIDCQGDMSHAGDCDAIRSRRHSAWLALAQRSEPTAYWADLDGNEICR